MANERAAQYWTHWSLPVPSSRIGTRMRARLRVSRKSQRGTVKVLSPDNKQAKNLLYDGKDTASSWRRRK